MKLGMIPGASANPFVIWTDLAWKTGELMMTSGQVIGYRMLGMALAGPTPSLRDRREFTLMSQEKIQAAAESAQAMGSYVVTLNQQLAALAVKQMFAGAAAIMSLASSRTAAESIGRQTKLLGDTLTHSAAVASHLSNATARLTQRGLRPIRARAARNAKRLRKR
jgi:hypothetical protein